MAFSTCIKVENDGPELVLTDKTPVAELYKLSETEYTKMKANFARPFDINGGVLCRVAVCETENGVYLLTDIHHLIYDGFSTNIFERGLDLAYRGLDVPKEKYSVFDAGQEERRHDESEELKASYDYFEHLLAGVETDSNILPDRADADQSHCGSLHYEMGVSAKDVIDFAHKNNTTENVVLLSAFSYALAKFTGQGESLFASINHGRRGKPLENTIGFFVRTFPLYMQIDEDSTVADYIACVRENYIETMRHSDVSFAELSHRYGIRSDVKYVYQGNLIGDFTFAGKDVKKTLLDCDDALSNLDVMITLVGDSFNLRLDYRNGMYTEGNILAFANIYSCIEKEMLTKEYLKDMEFVSEADKKTLANFNATEQPYDARQTVWQNVIVYGITMFILICMVLLYFGLYYGITEALK